MEGCCCSELFWKEGLDCIVLDEPQLSEDVVSSSLLGVVVVIGDWGMLLIIDGMLDNEK